MTNLQTKFCSSCNTTKPTVEFNKHKRMKDGLASICKSCKKVTDKIYRENNKESVAAIKAKNYQENKTRRDALSKDWIKKNPSGRKAIIARHYENKKPEILIKQADYRKENKDLCASRIKDWELRNQDRVRAKGSRRRAAKANAQPAWLTDEQKEQIVAFYSHARDCELVSGQAYHVDHIVPLQGKGVCGLHVPWNLQVLPSDLNLSKSNKHDPEGYS